MEEIKRFLLEGTMDELAVAFIQLFLIFFFLSAMIISVVKVLRSMWQEDDD